MHCPECGFVNAEGANYCQRCGALMPRAEVTGALPGARVEQAHRVAQPHPVAHDGEHLGGGSIGNRRRDEIEIVGERLDLPRDLDVVELGRDRPHVVDGHVVAEPLLDPAGHPP